MSRVGKKPVEIPKDVEVSVNAGQVSVKGPKGALHYNIGSGVNVSRDGTAVVVSVAASDKQTRANFGTTRAMINNMVKGVTKGWQRSLEMSGVGYTAKVAGDLLTLAVGYSHEVKIIVPKGVTCSLNKNIITLDSCDKEAVGTLASRIRKVRPPEPYLGKGIKYVEEKIRRKAGKAGKAGKT